MLLQQHAAAKNLQSVIGMETQGEKRPRDEHAWTNIECLICREATGPFPVLHPGCSHGYCPRCLLKKEKKCCDLCKKVWWFGHSAHKTPMGNLIIVRRVDGGFLYSKRAILFQKQTTDERTDEECIVNLSSLRKKNPEMYQEWMVQERMVQVKTVHDRVGKFLSKVGPGAHSEDVGDGAWVVLAKPDGDEPVPAAYITVHRTEIAKLSSTWLCGPALSTKAMRAILAVHDKITAARAEIK